MVLWWMETELLQKHSPKNARNSIEVPNISYTELTPPLLNPPSRVIGKLAVAKELAPQRWVAGGWVGSHCTWYHGELLKVDQLQSIWPWLSPCEQGSTLHEECGPLARASALQPGVQVLLLVQRYTMLKWLNRPACFVFQFEVIGSY